MKLWLLTPRKEYTQDIYERLNPNPWHPWYDKCFGMVLRAESDEAARRLAAGGSANIDKLPGAWLSPKYADCVEITADGPAEIILEDFRSA